MEYLSDNNMRELVDSAPIDGEGVINWYDIIREYRFSDNIIREYAENLSQRDWDTLVYFQGVSDDIAREYAIKVNSSLLNPNEEECVRFE